MIATATIPTLSSQYDPAIAEAKWQQFWEDHQVFKADPNHPGEPYCVVIPPPNVTGSLHMGHAFESALIDTLVRYHRMIGRNTLWLPGTDHASIAVSTILDRELQAQGKSRSDVGREAYLKRAWEWKLESGGTIVNQLRRLGVSVDWSRERFTLDEGLSAAVIEAFVQMHEQELIYRGEYLVNWCPASQSAVSDLEVDNQEVNGHLWHFRYPLTDGTGFVEVATTRPETMLGDTAVAVNPGDDRYQGIIGKMVRLPIVDREIPIIADEYVDSTFGTGCVKVTPAHDPNDFEMGKRHQLPFINIMNKDGSLNEHAGEFQGQDRFLARKQVVAKLKALDCLVKVEDYKHTVPYSDRGKVPVEPLLSTQWFVKIEPLAQQALIALDQHQSPAFVPERWTKVYRDWLVNLKDWCISRQLWWGHQIPAWYVVSLTEGKITDQTHFFVARTEAEARQQAEELFGPDVQLMQDPDVLDTWFSSGLWPFSTLGWPQQTADLSRYYPTTTLVTGFDIIFFWVARMTMMAGHFTGAMPFQTVYIHGLVRDENNKKMSKSANNGIDPLLLMNKYGTDALRYTLIREVAGAGQDIRMEYNRKTDESASVEAARNFTNKLWNASRFVMLNLDGQTPEQLTLKDLNSLEMSDRWILSRYYQTVEQTRNYLDHYGLGEAAKGLYEFIWGDFCDWYIELVKSRLQGDDPISRRTAQQTLALVLEGILKLLHPLMPHITEEIWQTLTQTTVHEEGNGKSGIITLALQPYPEADPTLINPDLEQQFELLINTIRTIRNLRAESDIKPSVKVQTTLQSESPRERQILTAGATYIQDLAKVDTLDIVEPPAQVLPPLDPGVGDSSPRAPVPPIIAEPVADRRVAAPAPQDHRPILLMGLVVVALVVLKMIQSFLAALNTMPLLPGCFQLVGLVYTLWFLARYVVLAKSRQEFSQLVQTQMEPILGQPLPEAMLKLRSSLQPPVALPLSPSPEMVLRGAQLGNLERVEILEPVIAPQKIQMAAGVVGTVQVLIPLAGVVDVAALRGKLQKDLSKVEAEIASLSTRLSQPNFVDKARVEVVQGAKDNLTEAEKQAKILRDRLSGLT
ncbi:valyl-tRNA synthetase [Neosynechococcus sphagnicola sy1]|uniref:Valine--tRNA ligase n=1 Tax=Neosynechococcus sphagnicola sy1 TaxID=1497020 RepID=A0A098TJK7_9CYAN|nr:valine--tRNA ligase [Neosynechococcus sphagnicola]KGF72439.1 valyl-tRNA synthetase [Neosynechococcus sphagnicola sy1]